MFVVRYPKAGHDMQRSSTVIISTLCRISRAVPVASSLALRYISLLDRRPTKLACWLDRHPPMMWARQAAHLLARKSLVARRMGWLSWETLDVAETSKCWSTSTYLVDILPSLLDRHPTKLRAFKAARPGVSGEPLCSSADEMVTNLVMIEGMWTWPKCPVIGQH